VEYLNQLNLKGDMVLDELKRVSSERDTTKQQLAEAEKNAKETWDEVADLRKAKVNGVSSDDKSNGVPASEVSKPPAAAESDPLGATVKSPTESLKSRKGSFASLSIFSPKSKAADSPIVPEEPEDLFSYDSELPRIQADLKEKQERIEDLQGEVKTLKGDLAVTRESTQSMANSLEEATRELLALRDRKDRSESELEEERAHSQKTIEQVKGQLRSAEERLEALKTEKASQSVSVTENLEKELSEAKQEIETLRSSAKSRNDNQEEIERLQWTVYDLEAQAKQLRNDAEKNDKRVATLNGLVSNLRGQLKDSEDREQEEAQTLLKLQKAVDARAKEHEEQGAATAEGVSKQAVDAAIGAQPASEVTSAKKKKNKKKNGSKSTEETSNGSTFGKAEQSKASESSQASIEAKSTISTLQEELRQLRTLLEEKDTAIESTRRKIKDQDNLHEEIESLRDDLLNIGQEHVEVKDQCKELLAEKSALQKVISDLETEVAMLKVDADSTAGSEEEHKDLIVQFDDLKAQATSLQTDLSAAEQLATTRFKDISELRSTIQKAQPELTSLRSENAELRSVRETLGKKEAEVKSLSAKHEEMRSELTKLKQTVSEQEAEIKNLNQKISQEASGRVKAEEAGSKSAQEVQRLNTERRQANESIDRLSTQLSKAQDDLATSRSKLREIEQQLSKFRSDSEGMKEEAELNVAQYASAQSLMSSMRDQTAEMAMQTREAKERCESLEEEVAEAHRLLSERTREAETMRRLLADVEGRADARTREIKERMDTAIEERDRAEDEASTTGRRRGKEMETLRNTVHQAERNLKRAEDDKEELENAQRDWKRRREDLEQRSEKCRREMDEVRSAMGELRDALDESERQARDLERQKAELRRSVEETQVRLEKLQKTNKVCSVSCNAQRHTDGRDADHGRRAPNHPNGQDQGHGLGRTIVSFIDRFRPTEVTPDFAKPSKPASDRRSQRTSWGLDGLFLSEERASAILGAEG